MLKFLHVVILAVFKYILTIPYARLIGLNYSQTLITVLIGGIGGFLFFYYLSSGVLRRWKSFRPYLHSFIPHRIKKRFLFFHEREIKTPRKIFSSQSRFLVRMKRIYGFWGIIIATPVLLTIPFGAILASKYYSHKKYIVGYMVASIVGWAVFVSTLIQLFPRIVL